LILGQLWKKNFTINHPIFKKRRMPTQNNSESLVHINVRRKPKPTVKNYQRLGYILYEATTSSRVTFSYELTGVASGDGIPKISPIKVAMLRRIKTRDSIALNLPPQSRLIYDTIISNRHTKGFHQQKLFALFRNDRNALKNSQG
jgi:hypothetical protein